MIAKQITHHRLRELLHYQQKKGAFVWKMGINKGKIAGSVTGPENGRFITIRLDRKTYVAHRLAWFLKTKEWPTDCVMAKNGDLTDLRWSNLSTGSRTAVQGQQDRPHVDSQTGVLGVSPHRRKFIAKICIGREKHYLGLFATMDEASKAYWAAKKQFKSPE